MRTSVDISLTLAIDKIVQDVAHGAAGGSDLLRVGPPEVLLVPILGLVSSVGRRNAFLRA